jgi:hypothetical protein
MKTTIFLMMVILTYGCANPTKLKTVQDYEYEWNRPINVTIIDEALVWCSKNITYKSDAERNDYWQTPQQTYDKRTGDCDDFCLMFVQLAHELGYEPELIGIKIKTRGEITGHMVVKIDDIIYDVQPARKLNKLEDNKTWEYIKTRESYQYSEALWRAENYHKGRLILNN